MHPLNGLPTLSASARSYVWPSMDFVFIPGYLVYVHRAQVGLNVKWATRYTASSRAPVGPHGPVHAEGMA